MEQSRLDPIPDPAVRRLSLYLRQLESAQRNQQRTISSKQLGQSLGLTDTQVRKDLAYFGQFGHPGIGYEIDALIVQVRRILGTDRTWNVLLVGAGNLGRALLAYDGFDARGFHLVAVFDNAAAKIGRRLGHFTVQALSDMPETVRRHRILVAMICVPAVAAQSVADQLVEAGVRGLLNFASISLAVPPSIALSTVDVAIQLEQLSFQINGLLE